MHLHSTRTEAELNALMLYIFSDIKNHEVSHSQYCMLSFICKLNFTKKNCARIQDDCKVVYVKVQVSLLVVDDSYLNKPRFT